jgi:hypothetical protein
MIHVDAVVGSATFHTGVSELGKKRELEALTIQIFFLVPAAVIILFTVLGSKISAVSVIP